MTPWVGYLLQGDITANQPGMAYNYLIGNQGVFLRAENAHLCVTIPVALGELRGLQPVAVEVELRHGLLPNRLWQAMVKIARAVTPYQREILFQVRWLPERGYVLAQPRLGDATAVHYAPDSDIVLQFHSHHVMPTYFSTTDNHDELGLALYGVIGRFGRTDQPPQVRLRLGAYGYYHNLTWSQVFADTIGEVEDSNTANIDVDIQPASAHWLTTIAEQEDHP